MAGAPVSMQLNTLGAGAGLLKKENEGNGSAYPQLWSRL
jgi:hypothetical protein